MKFWFVLIFTLFYSVLFSQREANNWYFGLNAGLSFATGSPVALTDGQLVTEEGCATISNSSGQLLFYTDGRTIYNRNHQIMLNGSGLFGHTSSSQSATIVPKPGSTSLYYVFTIDAEARERGLCYSIVDMSLDGGLGGVTNDKNILLYVPTCEKISVIKHSNTTDYWIVTHAFGSNAFISYLLTSNGLSASPITSNVGFSPRPPAISSSIADNSRGCMKISPNGSKIAVAYSATSWEIRGYLQVLDFDNTTGLITNPITLREEGGELYGVEFSPNSEVLYFSNVTHLSIIQFDLTSPDVANSAVILQDSSNAQALAGAFQLGPDNKIYVSHSNSNKIGVINNPNVIGIGCDLQLNSIDLGGKICQSGLPAFNQSFFFTPSIQLNNACVNQNTAFQFSTNQTVISANWNFGDGTTSNLINPTHSYSTAGNYTVSVSVTGTNGTGNNTRQITIYPKPNLLNTAIALKQCDDNNDGFSAFNLNETIPLLVSNPAGLTFTFHETLLEAQNNTNSITNTTAYANQIVSNDIIYVRVENSNGCYKTAQINLYVSTTLIPSTFQIVKNECDNIDSGSITDGIATFDFSAATAQIRALFPTGQLLNITYYKNLSDALAEQNAITNISNYSNVGYPNTQTVYARVDSQINNECLGLGPHIQLNVEPIPIVQPQVIKHCDDNQDGVFGFDTSNLQSNLLNGLTNVLVTYADQNGVALPSPLPNPFRTTSQTITATIKNNYGNRCSYSSTIQFIVDVLPQVFPIPTTLTSVCDDESNPVLQNGTFSFDTSTFQSTLLGGQNGMIVNYYDANLTLIQSPLPNPFTTSNQNVTVEIINSINNSCKASSVVPFVINPVPNINLIGNELICSDNRNFTKVINAGLVNTSTINNYTYTWYLNNVVIPNQNQYTLTVNTEGVYTVEVKNSFGCSRTRTITVTASNRAIINSIIVNDLVDENSIVVFLSPSSLGDYIYSIDGLNYQNSNTFSNIASGIYTVYVKDTKGCGITPKEVSVLGIPNYFTPNGDSYNDFWNIKGVNTNLNSKTIIYLFDRYGKLLTKINPLKQGWDGTSSGYPLPASDYWYSIELEDGRTVKGHFSLIR
jgi:gliding motility-associated-like protein